MKSLVVVLALLLPVCVTAQSKTIYKNLSDTTAWSEGTIIKPDGQQVKGILRFNDQIGTLSFSDGQEEFTFSPNRLAGFQFTDKENGKMRYFYVLENYNEKLKANKKDFYELLFDFRSFTIWSMVDQFETKIYDDQSRQYNPNTNSTSTVPFPIKRQVTKQIEFIYLMSEEGPLVEFLSVESRERGNDLPDAPDETSKGDLNHNLLQKYVGEDKYDLLKRYARENKLSWRKKRDVIKIMEYYGTIRG